MRVATYLQLNARERFPSTTLKEGMRVQCKVARTVTMSWENKVIGISELGNDNEHESVWALA
jgi:hypothetical protein